MYASLSLSNCATVLLPSRDAMPTPPTQLHLFLFKVVKKALCLYAILLYFVPGHATESVRNIRYIEVREIERWRDTKIET